MHELPHWLFGTVSAGATTVTYFRAWVVAIVALLLSAGHAWPTDFSQPDPQLLPDVFLWSDTSNVWVLRDGNAALLIGLGDGSVLDRLPALGIRQVEWVLFTDHHRETCQGAPRLSRSGAKVAAPAAERALFERPTEFRKMKVRLSDAYTVHGASYVRPPVQAIKLDRTFSKMDTFTWRGYEFWCVETKGSSPGGMSYILHKDKRWFAFSGDVMLEGGRMHTWFDSEWDYGFASGIHALANSAAQLAGYDPAWLLPAHGPAIATPRKLLLDYQAKLTACERLMLRGYPVFSFANAIQDQISRPTDIPHLWQVLPHVYKFRGPDLFPNFYLILSDSGHALAVDCGLVPEPLLSNTLAQMKEKLGLTHLDAMIATHMHGDHFLQGPFLREKYGTKLWAIDRMAEVCEHPQWFAYSAPIQAYGNGVESVKFDRLFKSGETFHWEGFDFTVDWMPGQTEFALALTGIIDGQKVVFTGDNLFGDTSDPSQTGHEAVVAHNSAILEEGYILGAEYLKRLNPDLILGGHSYVMPQPAAFIERYRQWSYAMRDMLQTLSSGADYRPWFDPFWVRAQPYRSSVHAGEEIELTLHLRNFSADPQRLTIAIHTPAGLTPWVSTVEVVLSPGAREKSIVRLRSDRQAEPGVRIIAFDITRDGKRLGELFDAVVEVIDR